MNPLLRLLPVLLLAAAPTVVPAADPAPAYPPVTINNSQLRVLPRSANGRDYQLYVSLPAGYAQHPEKRYPVLYATDGYWDFPLLSAIYGNLFYDKVVPEFIVVGIGYAGQNPDFDTLRRYDLTPVADTSKKTDPSTAGHAAEFLGVIEQEIIPFMEREYRVDSSYRVLGGHSLGGLFALYALFERPGLFQSYLALSPGVDWGDGWIFRREEEYAKSGGPLPGRLLVTGAADEWPFLISAILRFNAQMQPRTYRGLTYQWRLVEGERHSGTKAEGWTRGLRFGFAPLAPK